MKITDKEVWKDIKGYEGLYTISNHGRVKSKRKGIILKNFSRSNTRVEFSVNLFKHNIRKTIDVSRLVAIHFISNQSNYKYVLFKDNNPYNLGANNLYWGNSSTSSYKGNKV